MIARLRQSARHALDVVRLLPALPEVVITLGELEHRLSRLEAITNELYIGTPETAAEGTK